jgi:type I restriction enzyme S subunit
MEQLLTGKRRFKGFSGEWEPVTFGSFLKESRVPGSNGAEARKLTIRLYGKGIVPKSDTRPGSEATQFYKRKAGQFIYSKLDFLNGAFGIIPPNLDGFESSLDLPSFDVEPSIDSRWLLYFVTRRGFYTNQLGLAHGGRKARRVNPKDLLKLSIRVPRRQEQVRIADALQTIDHEIDSLSKELNALKKQKTGLMQMLMTGKLRLTS